MSSRLPRHHQSFAAHLTLVAICCAFLSSFLFSENALAQSPRNFRIPPYDLPDVESGEGEAEVETLPESSAAPVRVIVDTDPGVDDAAALVWLLSQSYVDVEVEGIVTVAGNTTVDNGVNNVQFLLGLLGEDITVVRGADAPLSAGVLPSQVPWLIHGPDGLWFTGAPPADAHVADATSFYCNGTALEPGTLVIALGPLTNLATAMAACNSEWSGVEIISVGGSRATPNQTPVTEYNYWQDPEAARNVLALAQKAGATVEIVLSDAFSQFEITQSDLGQLQRRGGPAMQALVPALGAYIYSLSEGGTQASLPDPSAVIYALANELGTAQSALVEVLAGKKIPEVVRGQTVIGLTLNERITMIASDAQLSQIAVDAFTIPNYDLLAALGAILFSQPDNAQVVVDIDARRMEAIFLEGVSVNSAATTGTATEDFENQLFVPFVQD